MKGGQHGVHNCSCVLSVNNQKNEIDALKKQGNWFEESVCFIFGKCGILGHIPMEVLAIGDGRLIWVIE